jgi:hypothetical protein
MQICLAKAAFGKNSATSGEMVHIDTEVCNAILIMIKVCETASNGFWYRFTTGKPLENLKPTLNYYENGSILTPRKRTNPT